MGIRELFPVFSRLRYLDWASIGPIPTSAAESASEFLRLATEMRFDPSFRSYVNDKEQETRGRLSKLINAKPEEISFTGTSTTEGVQIFFRSLNPAKGSNIVTTDLEFPLMATELSGWNQNGVQTRIWKNRIGSYHLEDLEKIVDRNTACVAISSVNWVNGFRLDLKGIADIAHERGALVLVDSIQHAGNVSLDVTESGVDAVSGGAHKWLLSPMGTGFLFVSRNVSSDLRRVNFGYGNVEEPSGGWDLFYEDREKQIFRDYSFANDHRRFQYGAMKNHIGITTLNESLKIILGIEERERDAIAFRLRKQLLEWLTELNLRILSPVRESDSSGIVTFTTGSIGKDRSIHRKLLEENFRLSLRGAAGIGGMRVSVNFLNDASDIDHLVQRLAFWTRK